MNGFRFGMVGWMLIRGVVALVAGTWLDAAAIAQDVNSCLIQKCTSSETCFLIDVRRCANPNPRLTGNSCNFAIVVPGCDNPDTDGDGLADTWEDNQAIDLNCDGVYDSNDVRLPGANKYVQDVYLKISAMQSAPNEPAGAHVPSQDSINSVVAAFSGAHLKAVPERCSASTACSAGFVCSDFVCLPACTTDADCGAATDGGRCVDGVCRMRRLHADLANMTVIPHSNVMSFGPVKDACVAGGSGGDPAKAVNFYDIKANPQNFDAKEAVFKRFGVFGHFNTCDSPETCAVCPVDDSGSTHTFGSSGLAEVVGNDFMITLAEFQLATGAVKKLQEAGGIMHELGHNLGLEHFGPGATDAPTTNHVSVMNYLYNFGIPTTDAPGTTTLGPRTAVDFSHAALGPLDEMLLDESTGVSPGFEPPFNTYLVKYWSKVSGPTRYGSTHPGTPIDWNGDGIVNPTPVSVDLNKDGTATSFFPSTEEWSRLVYAFQCSWTLADGAPPPAGYVAPREIDVETARQLDNLFPPVVAARLDVSKECIDVTSNGVVPVTLYGSATFDVTAIVLSTVRLNNATAISTSLHDKDGDGYLDLSGRFRSNEMQLGANSTVATLVGKLTNGQSFEAYDTVKVVSGSLAHCQQ